ncbi:MAG: GatB/YqeY domain-containing protein [Alphaproteobacteria bacterium]|nr:GatB/YqeY domain-containing protein [Alphaproteobacteria bacterium]
MLVIDVPATLANLGAGYDTLGLAVGLHNRFTIRAGVWGEDDLVAHTARRAGERFGTPCPPFTVEQEERVPRSRGLGSSATARVAGLLAWRELTGAAVDEQAELAFLAAEECHPDNVWPARLGGLVVCGALARRAPVHPSVRVAVVSPAFEVSTPEARAALPSAVPHADAVANLGALALLLVGLRDGDPDALAAGVVDRLHQPYRAHLLGPVDAAFANARELGAAPFVSGSGSTLAAFVTGRASPSPTPWRPPSSRRASAWSRGCSHPPWTGRASAGRNSPPHRGGKMSILERVSEDLKVAMKARDKDRLQGLRGIRAAFIEALKADGSETLDPEEELAILRRLAKQRRESIDAYVAGGREELADTERAELAVIEGYLPSLAGPEQTAAWVDAAIAATGASTMKDMGKVMGALMKDHKAELDAKLANTIIKERLG